MSTEPSLFFDLLRLAAAESVDSLLPDLLERIANATDASEACLAVARDGVWQIVASTDSGRDMPPLELLAQVADQGPFASDQGWTAIRVKTDAWLMSLLALRSFQYPRERLAMLAAAVEQTLQLVYRSEVLRRRGQRMSTILDIANRWHDTLELEPLLEDMAKASVELLDAERATIFLWDRRSRTLVGRPALGVEEGELRIPDSVGVVGRVVQSGQPARVAASQADQEIDRSVDEQVQFVTRNLVCVPLVSRAGKILGAFQLLNRRGGDFTSEDESELTDLAAQATSAIENCRHYRTLLADQSKADDQEGLLGNSPAIAAIREKIQRVAPSDLPVLMLGENGTGKEVASRLIHRRSPRQSHPFVAINCAAITESLLESELFGHEKGAFTDAHETRPGKLEIASKGTLFLDEVGELPLTSQAKLLRAIEEKVIVRVGGSENISTNARIIAATNRDLPAMVRDHTFREDLFFRLNVVTITMPPLRDRAEDIVELANHLLEAFCAAANRPVPQLTKGAMQRLRTHAWPGNVRELRNLMQRMVYLATDDTITEGELQLDSEGGGNAVSLPLSEATKAFQVEYIERQIALAGGNMAEAARRLGLHRSNLYRKMGQLGMSDGD